MSSEKKRFFGLGNFAKKINTMIKGKPKETPIPKHEGISSNSTSSSSYAPSMTEPIGQKKLLNIQLSEDDKDIYNLNDDEEEEEEEEEEEIENKKITDNNNNNNQIENKTINNDNKKEKKEEPELEEICTSKKKNNEEIDTELSSRSNNIPVYIYNTGISYEENIEIKNSYCHRVRRKGTYFSLKEVDCFSIQKIKKVNNFFTKIGFKDTQYSPVNYLLFFEEHFIYFAKDIEVDKTNKDLRKVGNKYSLYMIINLNAKQIDDENNNLIKLQIYDEKNNNSKEKEFIISNDYFKSFINKLQTLFKLFGIDTSSQ